MVSRKRGRAEMEEAEEVTLLAATSEVSQLQRIRNLWEFACLNQYIHFFGEVVKIDQDLDVDAMEMECVKPNSEKLSEIGLALLKYVSSHRGLTPEIFDEYTRRQYLAKAPQRNPFGDDEEPKKFTDFDVINKLRILHQLSVWTLGNPDRIRERLALTESKQLEWRIEPFGWDADDRTYFVLDDNRLYRRTDAPIVEPPRQKSKKKTKVTRSSRATKRRRVVESSPDEEDEESAPLALAAASEENTLGGMTWECIAVTLEEYQTFLATIQKSKDPNEKILRNQITNHVLPELERQADERHQKELRKLKELEVLQKLATAKRSSRIAGRMEQRKEQELAEEAERKKLADIAMAHKEQERLRKMEEARETRIMTREQRVKERDMKRILHEEELTKLEEDKKKLESNEARLSERHLRAEMERRQRELEELQQEDEWFFDCEVCGMHGENLDDGTHSIACEKCNIWQHSACHGFKQEEAEKDDFHFICKTCRRKEEEAKMLKIPPIKLRLTPSPQSEAKTTSPAVQPAETPAALTPYTNGAPNSQAKVLDGVYLPPPAPLPAAQPAAQLPRPQDLLNGPSLPPFGHFTNTTATGLPASSTNGARQSSLSSTPATPAALPPLRQATSGARSVSNGGPSSSPPLYHYINGVAHSSKPLASASPHLDLQNQTPNLNLPRPNLPPPTFTPTSNAASHVFPPSQSPPTLPRPVVSPIKMASSPPTQSPQLNGHGNQSTTLRPLTNLAGSPNASFPPPGTAQAGYSPHKMASSPMQAHHAQQPDHLPPAEHLNGVGLGLHMTPGYSPVKSSPKMDTTLATPAGNSRTPVKSPILESPLLNKTAPVMARQSMSPGYSPKKAPSPRSAAAAGSNHTGLSPIQPPVAFAPTVPKDNLGLDGLPVKKTQF